MKRDEPRPTSRHQLDHAVPTVIHNPEDDLPVLARWLHRAMQDQTRFWGVLAAVVAVVIGLSVLANSWGVDRSETSKAWMELELAKGPPEQEKVAQDFPEDPVTDWARLQAATGFYNQGFDDLPANRDAALPRLKKALDLFEQVAQRVPKDAPEARVAALGVARTLEARNELDKAIRQYEKVAQTWPGTPEAREADRLAAALKKPEAVEFYKQLYAYKPVEMSLPPMGRQDLSLPPNHPPLNGPTVPTSTPFSFPPLVPGAAAKSGQPSPSGGPLPMIPPPPPEPAGKGSAAAAAGQGSELPPDVFAPGAQEKGTPAQP
jgi:tetratricopeptide (TPR) repeat protein